MADVNCIILKNLLCSNYWPTDITNLHNLDKCIKGKKEFKGSGI